MSQLMLSQQIDTIYSQSNLVSCFSIEMLVEQHWHNQCFNTQYLQSQEIIGLREWLRQEQPDIIGDWWWLCSKQTKKELIQTEWSNSLAIARLKSRIALRK